MTTFKLFVVLIFFSVIVCQKANNKQFKTERDSVSVPISVENQLNDTIKTYRMLLTNGDTVTVAGFVPSSIIIDSIIYFKDTFRAIYNSCHKGGALSNFKNTMRQVDKNEYGSLRGMTTAYSLYDSSGYQFGFNSKNADYCQIPKGSRVKAFSTIYSLFANNKLIIKLLIIDSMKVI
jgi:hypothetical protein